MSKLSVSLACGRYDRTAPILDGVVKIDGCDVIAHTTVAEETFFRALRHAEFDIAELSFSSYTLLTSQERCPYVAIPIFPSRSFRQNAIYVRRDGPVKTPADLRGRRIGVPEYQLTAHVWVRAFLEEDYAVGPGDVEWVTGGVEEAGRHEKTKLKLPGHIHVTEAGGDQTLSAMLLDGEIDALVCPRAPLAFGDGKGAIRRLFDDPAAVAADYYLRRGIFPIMHVVGIRKSLVEANPWLPASVFKAFAQAKALAMACLSDTTALTVSLPWLIEEVERTRAIMGDDFWSYGAAANRRTLEAFFDHHHRQGLSHGLTIGEAFHAATLEQYKI